ncbi:MAG: hypothetical protein J3K34DRAFT_413053 [Monoraphidium minutum]|nr:MAG: hypothetical protein J3K34DRAFT_413053 [Monoraphidium minutum]
MLPKVLGPIRIWPPAGRSDSAPAISMTGPAYVSVLVRSCACTTVGMPVLMATRTLRPRNSSVPGRLLSDALLNTTPAFSWDSSASGQSASIMACCIASAHDTASKASWNATVNESPSVVTSKPQYLLMRSRITLSCISCAASMTPWSHSHSSVDPSTSVMTIVTSRSTRSLPSLMSPGGLRRFQPSVRWMASWERLRYRR